FPTTEQRAWWTSNEWELGRQFFFEVGNDADAMLLRSRAAMTAFGVLAGVLVWLWSRRLFGPAAGLVSLTLFVLLPAALAHAALVTADMATAFTLTAAVAGWWWVLHRLTLPSLFCSTLATGALFLTKPSAVVLVPIVAV